MNLYIYMSPNTMSNKYNNNNKIKDNRLKKYI